VFATALWLLAFVNILIAVVNLLPVFPFDGSKLVHSLLWRAGRDQRLALVRLERGGREFSRVVAVLGFLLMAFGGEQLIGLTVLLLGVYLLRLPPSS
jgi:Zn-dependent protease